jgi:phosphoglucosamine mutase
VGKRFGTDGIRARAGEGPLAIDELERLGAATAVVLTRHPDWFPGLDTPHVVFGRDTRESGPAMRDALARGLHSYGVSTCDLGVLPTPGVSFHAGRGALGIVISASHNPWQDNGIKFIGPDRRKISDAVETAIESLLDDSAFSLGEQDANHTQDTTAAEPYIDWLVTTVAAGLNLSGWRILLDTAHGAAVTTAQTTFERLGAEVRVIHDQPNGRNINEDCGALYPEALNTLMADHTLGFTFDGDADRVMFSDGAVRDGDAILAICARWLKEQGRLPADTVVATVMSNLGLEKYLDAHGIALDRAKVGDKYVSRNMDTLGAVLGGEQSGHIIFSEYAPSGDGLQTALLICRAVHALGGDATTILDGFVTYPQLLTNVRVANKPDDPLADPGVQAAVAQASADPDLRVNVRNSGTESLIRVMVEGVHDDAVQDASRSIQEAVSAAYGGEA